METGHPSTRAFNSGSGNRALHSLMLRVCVCVVVQYSAQTGDNNDEVRHFTAATVASTDY